MIPYDVISYKLGGSNMNKSELIGAISDSTDLTKADAGRAINAVIDAIGESLAKGDIVSLVGFGSFIVKERRKRKGRNPQTGKTITIKAAKVPAFRPGKLLKERVNGS